MTHAWHGAVLLVDESLRPGGRYLLAAADVAVDRANDVRALLKRTTLRGQSRIHFAKESDRRRRTIIDVLVDAGLTAAVYDCGRGAPAAVLRASGLTRIARDAAARGVVRLVIESRSSQDELDRRSVYEAVGAGANLTYVHETPRTEPLLWIPDAVAWCYGARGDWRRRVDPLVVGVVDARR